MTVEEPPIQPADAAPIQRLGLGHNDDDGGDANHKHELPIPPMRADRRSMVVSDRKNGTDSIGNDSPLATPRRFETSSTGSLSVRRYTSM